MSKSFSETQSLILPVILPSADVLSGIISDVSLHVAWLEALSYLEYCGAQKIAGFVAQIPKRDQSMLQHLAEEFRHAYFFKKQADQLAAKHSLDQEKILSLLGPVGRRYLHLLDGYVGRVFSQYAYQTEAVRQASYLLTTYAIEKRALDLYETYECLLRKQDVPDISLRAVLKEESAHLHAIEKEIGQSRDYGLAVGDVLAYEEGLYQRFLGELSQKLPHVGRSFNQRQLL